LHSCSQLRRKLRLDRPPLGNQPAADRRKKKKRTRAIHISISLGFQTFSSCFRPARDTAGSAHVETAVSAHSRQRRAKRAEDLATDTCQLTSPRVSLARFCDGLRKRLGGNRGV
jgi:hypothetical protein